MSSDGPQAQGLIPSDSPILGWTQQEALRRSEERYRSVVEHLGEGMIVIQDEVVVFSNPQANEILRVPSDLLLGMRSVDLLHPEDRTGVTDRLARRQGGENLSAHTEIRRLDADGTLRWLETHSTNAMWEGRPATMSFFSDVTGRKAMVEALHRSEERYRAVVDHVDDGMVVVQGTRFVFVNPRAAEIAQMSVEEMLREGYLHRIHPDDRPLVDERRRRRLAGEEIANRYEIRLLLPDGTVRWIDIGVTIVPWDGSTATLTFFSDVTARKLLEAQFQRTLEEREAILNSALVGIVLSVARRNEWVNEKYAEMLGYSREDLMGQSSVHVHPDREVWERLGVQQRAALLAHGTFTNERQLRRRNGEVFWVQMAGRCVRDRDPDSGVIWTFLDITERKKAEDDTRAALARQRELNELRSRFVSMTSHEFRTPLASILSSAELLKDYGDRLPADEKLQIVQTIENGVHRMTGMLERVLHMGRAEAHMLEFQPHHLDLLALCTRLVEDARTQHPATACVVVTDFASDVPAGSYDEKLLRHVFGNLLSNAIKYSPQGGEIRFRVAREGARVVFEISDHGIGIPVAEIGHLFESFHRASNVGNIQGTGLGLAIIKSSLELHGGQIHVYSEPGCGTSFTVRI